MQVSRHTLRVLQVLLGLMMVGSAVAQGILDPGLLRQSGATDGQALCWSNASSRWAPCTISGGSDLDDTDDLTEGVVNLYFTNARARSAISASSPLSYSSATGVMSLLSGSVTIDNLTQITTRNYSSLQNIPSTFAPSAHASSHQHAGGDEIATATPGANAIPKAGAGGLLAAGWVGEAAVTQHQGALTLTESQISDLAHFSGAYGDLSGKPNIGDLEDVTITAWAEHDILVRNGVGQVVDSPIRTAIAASGLTHSRVPYTWNGVLIDKGALFFDQTTNTLTSGILNANSFTVGGSALSSRHLADIQDVLPSDGDCLVYDGVTDNRWEPTSCPGGGGGASELDDLSDVTLTTPSVSQFMRYNGSAWVNVAIVEADISDLAHFDGAYSSLTGVPSTFTPEAHQLDGAVHTVSGLTAGHVLRATGATTFGFGALAEAQVTQHEGALTLTQSQISDVTLSGSTTELATVSGTKTTGKQLAFDANGNVIASAEDIGGGGGGASELDDLSDVTITTPGAGETLRHNGTGWVNADLAFADLDGSIANGQTPESAVTQHEAALAIAHSQLTYTGLTAGHVLRASGATAASFSALPFTDITGSLANAQLPTGMGFNGTDLTIGGSFISTGPSLFDLSANATPGTPATDASRFAIIAKNGPLKQYDDTGALHATYLRDDQLSGNTTEVASVSGTKTTGKQLAFDANGNVIASAEDVGGSGDSALPSGRMSAAGRGGGGVALAHCPGVTSFGGATASSTPNPPAYAILPDSGNTGCVFLLPHVKPAAAGAIDYWVEVGATTASDLDALLRIQTVCTGHGDAWSFTGAGSLGVAATGTAYTFTSGSSINSLYVIEPADEGSSSPTLDGVSLSGCATGDVVGLAVWRTPLHASDTLQGSANPNVALYGIRYQFKE